MDVIKAFRRQKTYAKFTDFLEYYYEQREYHGESKDNSSRESRRIREVSKRVEAKSRTYHQLELFDLPAKSAQSRSKG